MDGEGHSGLLLAPKQERQPASDEAELGPDEFVPDANGRHGGRAVSDGEGLANSASHTMGWTRLAPVCRRILTQLEGARVRKRGAVDARTSGLGGISVVCVCVCRRKRRGGGAQQQTE